MQIILTHIGTALPPYLKYTFHQIRTVMPYIPVYFLSDQPEPKELTQKFNIEWKTINTSINPLDGIWPYPKNDFWEVTLRRFYHISEFMIENNLYNILHFENDVLVYKNFDQIETVFKHCYQNIGITQGKNRPWECMTGMMFLHKPTSLKHMLAYFEQILKDPDLVRNKGYDMLHEMSLMGSYLQENTPDNVDGLPTLPFGPTSRYINLFNGLFDPASWGQYALGTHTKPIPGWAETAHIIGHEILAKKVDLFWYTIDGYKIPFVKDLGTGLSYQLYNLHIHSKNLKEGLSVPYDD